MLKKSERLSRADFTTFFKLGKRYHTEHCTVLYTPSSSLCGSVVVGKKVSKRAVVRNRLRRRVYAQLAVLKLKKKNGVYIFVVKPSFGTLTKADAAACISGLIGRIDKTA